MALATIAGVRHRVWADLAARGYQATDIIHRQIPFPDDVSVSPRLKEALSTYQPDIIERCNQWQKASDDHHLISFGCDNYPPLLRQLSSPPLVLFVKGNTALLSAPQVAIVGSRRASRSGLDCAFEFAGQLVTLGIKVVSGLAMGIDGAAHRGALIVPEGTLAVLGSGVDVVYPNRHSQLYRQIVQSGGAVVSEFWPGTPARAQHFPRRNRIIAGLSLGTLVVEASIRSGTLITANMAIDMGKEVFAVPGNIHNPQTQGCHYLIQQGAKLVTHVEHILEELPCLTVSSELRSDSSAKKSQSESLATDKLLDSVDLDVTAVDIIAERNQLPVSEVLAALLEYELRGLITAVPGGYVKLRGK
ncbi:DNA-protecting protein DprA [Alteromonas aestuariivivens]|uniref:DNA-protecting protein DprA n=1 Tax=Alteromonas aestuariivivens TaxID=1938339 RepID=A0A3D8M5N1_9ALTE|nr:DNA-protecting protein DprA [Alteromonas aestuariivivens]